MKSSMDRGSDGSPPAERNACESLDARNMAVLSSMKKNPFSLAHENMRRVIPRV